MTLPTTDGGWKAELDAFLKDRGFPCVGAWDGFHVYISSNLKKFFNFKVARYSFPGPIPPKFEHKLRRHKQSFEKIATTVVLNKDENLL